MEKISRDAKEKRRAKEEGIGHRIEYPKPGPRDLTMIRPSQQSFDKDAEYTPLNSRHEDIWREVYNLKLLPITGHLKGVHIMMGKDENAWYAYHGLRAHTTKDCHNLKREIKILIHRGRLLSYGKDVKGHPGKRSPPRGDISSENPPQKKGNNTYKVREARVTRHILNTIAGGFARRGETSSARKRYACALMHIR